MAPTDEQAAICKRFGSAVSVPSADLKVGIALTTLRAKPLNALRHRPEAGTSGWYIWGGEHLSRAADFFQPLHVAHLSQYCAEIVPYIGLAPGWRVLLAAEQEDVWYDESLLRPEA